MSFCFPCQLKVQSPQMLNASNNYCCAKSIFHLSKVPHVRRECEVCCWRKQRQNHQVWLLSCHLQDKLLLERKERCDSSLLGFLLPQQQSQLRSTATHVWKNFLIVGAFKVDITPGFSKKSNALCVTGLAISVALPTNKLLTDASLTSFNWNIEFQTKCWTDFFWRLFFSKCWSKCFVSC